MTAVAEPPVAPAGAPARGPLALAEGVELLGGVHGSGYKEGAALVRRADGQMVQLGPLMYSLLECIDGERDRDALAVSLSEHLGRRVGVHHVDRLAAKLAAQGLLAGSEHQAPPRRNPLLALRWKVLVTDPVVTRRLTAPLAFLFRPWIVVPILACFGAVFWFVFVQKGVASATAQAMHSPGLLLLVFGLAVLSAGFHELGHAAACRYGGATPGGMGMGMYMVWPAFYTDVTDSYRLPRRDRLRVDLGGLYFNAVVAVLTMGIWLAVRSDALLLLVALQVLQMVKQLSPVIRADGYHILSDLTGVPDLYAHMGPTLRRLLPRYRRERSALSRRARMLVTLWVLIIVPILLSLSLSAVILLPRLATSAWDSGRHIATAIPHEAGQGQVVDVLASCVRLLALGLPVLGSVLVTQKVVRTLTGKARTWSRDSHGRRFAVIAGAAAAAALMAWAWWPAGQYQPVRAGQNGTLGGLIRLVSAPSQVARPAPVPPPSVQLTPGTHLAVTMIPVGGATARHPALFIIRRGHGKPPVAILSPSAPPPPANAKRLTAGAPAPNGSVTPAAAPTAASAGAATSAPASPPAAASAFPFKLPAAPGPGSTQALAVNTRDGGVTYDVAYALVTVRDGAAVTNTNSAFALAHCNACTTVAVSFQIVLIVGTSRVIAPINAAGALNADCPACVTTALADQIVVTLKSVPPASLVAELDADLRQLDALPALGAAGSPANVAAAVGAVQQEIEAQLNQSGVTAQPVGSNTLSQSSSSTTSGATSTAAGSSTGTSSAGGSVSAPAGGSQVATGTPSASASDSSATTTSATTTSVAASSATSSSAPGG